MRRALCLGFLLLALTACGPAFDDSDTSGGDSSPASDTSDAGE